jgi:hypothetical protein
MLFIYRITPILALLTFREEYHAFKAFYSGPLSVGRAFLFIESTTRGGERDEEIDEKGKKYHASRV